MAEARPESLESSFPKDAESLIAAQGAFGDGSKRLPPRAMKIALSQAPTLHPNDSSGSITEEDYDHLRPNPFAVVPGSHGGGFEDPSTTNSKPHLRFPKGRISKDAETGEYVLEAREENVKEILRDTVGVEKDVDALRKKKFKEIVFTRQFTAFDSNNVETAKSPYRGFFTLFWLGTAIFMTQIAVKNYVTYGHVFRGNEILHQMRRSDLTLLAISDGVLWLSTGFGWILQTMVARGWVRWNREGWIVQHIWQTFYIFAVISWTQNRGWSWSHSFFFLMHCLIMLMKQHSYAFYNGHLSELYKARKSLQKTLNVLQDRVPVETSSPTTPRHRSPVTTEAPLDIKATKDMRPPADLIEITDAIESGAPLDQEQIEGFERMIKSEIYALSVDLQGKASSPENAYPNNLSLKKHYEFTLLPTLVYELEYPRTDKIDWLYVLEKAAATAGVLFLMHLVSQTFIYPVVMHTVQMKEDGLPVHERLEHFPWMISDLTLPFMMEYMMTWYVLFESVLNLLAEVTYFADRGFYGDWWNSVSWDQYARDWNKPVHLFLLRHVYHSSLSSFHLSRHSATLVTFLLSAFVHELLMFVLFKKLRGYLMLMQLSQIPLVQLSRTRWLKGRKTLGNLIFWVGLFTGPSLLCSLYLVI